MTQIVTLDAKQFVGILLRTDNTKSEQDIGLHWQRFYQENILNQVSHKKSDTIYALYTDYEKDHTAPYSVLIGCEVWTVDTLPKGLVCKTIPSSSYQIFQAKGKFPTTLIETWQKIWKTDLPRSYTGDFEVYGKAFHQETPEVDVYISLND